MICARRYIRGNSDQGANREFFPESDREDSVVLLIEGKGEHESFDEILNVPGVNNVFSGPYGLSVSLGIPGDVTHPKVINAITEMVQKATKKRCFLMHARRSGE